MTEGLVILAAWLELGAIVAVLSWVVLRRRDQG